jgi:predicted transglutaminase-like cysteine proteinase
VSKKITGALLLALLGIGVLGQHADAALFGLPKSLKTASVLDGVEMNLPIWGPSAKSFYCVQHLVACQRLPGQAQRRALPKELPQQAQPKEEAQLDPPQPRQVAMFSLPKSLKGQLERVPQDTPTLAPMAHTIFCMKYPKECEVRKIAFRGTRLDLTAERMADLTAVNLKINRNIRPERNTLGLAGEKWLIAPTSGDCNDYAVTKRHELLEKGWPSRSLLLAEVVMPSGEHHLVVVVRSRQGDFVLDNMSSSIRPWAQTPYRWVRIQSAANPKFWSSVKPAARSV